MNEVDLTAWEYGGDVTCPSCWDNSLYFGIRPIWATDQAEVWEVMCPVCGVIDTISEVMDNEEMDRYWHDLKSYIEYRGGLDDETVLFVCRS